MKTMKQIWIKSSLCCVQEIINCVLLYNAAIIITTEAFKLYEVRCPLIACNSRGIQRQLEYFKVLTLLLKGQSINAHHILIRSSMNSVSFISKTVWKNIKQTKDRRSHSDKRIKSSPKEKKLKREKIVNQTIWTKGLNTPQKGKHH